LPFFEYKPTSTLHYYCGVTAFEAILKSKSLWLSDIKASNDPREIQLGQEAFSEAMRSLTARDVPGLDKRAVSGFVAETLQFSRISTFFTCCFSLAGDELPMWREYAEGGTGLAIGFRPTGLSSIPGRMQLVQYSDAASKENFHATAVQAALWMGRTRSIGRVLAMSEALAAITSFKHRSWAYEKEVRIGLNQLNHKPDAREVLTNAVSEHPDGELVKWRQPFLRSSRGKDVAYLAHEFGRRKNGNADSARAIQTVTRGPRCAMSALEIQALMESEGYEGFAVIESDCAIQ
jgi:hypothetical protein